ncbi:hypothetical protein K469DRAFT_662005 [Zopfia rhizophila CBS 207.26]|uniref:Uncharacterized protein n=1 Tax=Zopfia rhizophila CBS 207.26 TaxID=1314779 RepID=A0A6A6E7A3_9PEZI|nr:hypothetical protein K469DRAFT_662005 [Zopfia rhizophila CBS 207.26]
MTDLSVYDNDPTLYIFTSLTAGSSHIITATSRIETILKANKIPFKGVDTATDDLARKLYGRRAQGKKLPLLVKEGYVLGDLEQIEEWNEYGELKEALGVTAAAPAPKVPAPSANAQPPSQVPKENVLAATSEQNLAIRQLGAEAAAVAASKKAVPGNISTTNPLLAEKVNTPTASTPTKSAASGILSPRSIPLPATPITATEKGSETKEMTDVEEFGIPKPGNVKPKLPPSMHLDAANPALDAGPIAVSQASPTHSSSKSPPVPMSPPARTGSGELKHFHGSSISIASDEEIKQIEQEQAIPEVSSEEEEDEEDMKLKEKASSPTASKSAEG